MGKNLAVPRARRRVQFGSWRVQKRMRERQVYKAICRHLYRRLLRRHRRSIRTISGQSPDRGGWIPRGITLEPPFDPPALAFVLWRCFWEWRHSDELFTEERREVTWKWQHHECEEYHKNGGGNCLSESFGFYDKGPAVTEEQAVGAEVELRVLGFRRFSVYDEILARIEAVVNMINGCVTVLEGGEFEGLTQKEALRFLVHLIGDVHQPLHTVAGYYDVSDPQHPKLITNFTAITSDTPSDGGGNALDYGPGELHACWDKVLVSDIFATNDPVALAANIMVGVSADSYRTAGKPASWAAKWASDSMKQAIGAYADVEFGMATFDQHGDLTKIDVTLKPSTATYRAKNAQVVKEQLRKGGIHLAQLLNAIQWDLNP